LLDEAGNHNPPPASLQIRHLTRISFMRRSAMARNVSAMLFPRIAHRLPANAPELPAPPARIYAAIPYRCVQLANQRIYDELPDQCTRHILSHAQCNALDTRHVI